MILFGHRGAKGEAPENTVDGFVYARGLGITSFELDIRLTADDQLVLMHDQTVDRTTSASGPVSAFTAADLAAVDAWAEHPDWPNRVGVPTLTEVFEAVPDAAEWEVEIKTDSRERLARICDLLPPVFERFGVRERVKVSSFDPVALELITASAPHLPRCFIAAYDTPESLETALRLGAVRAGTPLASSSREMVRAVQDAGLEATGWPGNTEEGIRTLMGWGVDNITTDYPTLAMRVMAGG
jgi:glycerophosphoryl diester phosphodiesterase